MLGTLKVQRKPNTLRIAKTVAVVAAAVAMKKEQRLPCPKGHRPPIRYDETFIYCLCLA